MQPKVSTEEIKKSTSIKKPKENKRNFFVPRRDYGDDFTEKELEMIKKNLSKART